MFRAALRARVPAPGQRTAGARLLCAAGVALLVLPLAIIPSPVAAYPTVASEAAAAEALAYLRSEQLADGSVVDYGTTCWVVCAVVAADEDPAAWDDGGASLVDYLEAEVDSLSSAFNYSLAIMAVVAAGEDPTSFGGADLVSLLEGEYSSGQLGNPDYLNDDFWGLMALVAAGDAASSSIVSNVRDFIEDNQSNAPADVGSWSWGVGQDGDVDDTAAAIMALIAAGMSPTDPAIVEGLAYLRQNQDSSGGFLSWGSTNPDTDSWAILSLVAADEDPDSSEWKIGDNSPVDDLLSFQQAEGEFFLNEDYPETIPKTTASAVQALLGRPWPVEIASSSSPDAELMVTPSDFEFVATEDGGDPLERILEIWNEGSGEMDWEVESDEDWLELSPSSGSSSGEHDDVTLSVDISGLAEDDYEATITITAGGADGSPETVDVTLEVSAAASDAEIAFNPSSLEFTAEEGGSDPPDQVLEIWNADSAPDSIDWEVECDEDWLNLDPADGTMDEEHEGITVSVDIDGLDPDTYEATITITAPDADNSPETIDVTLEVEGDASAADDPEIDFSPSRFRFSVVEGGDDPDDETLTIWNSGEGTLDWSVSDDTGWLSLSPRSGSSTGENDEDEVDVSVDISRLDAGEYEAEIVIVDSDASNSPQDLTVTLTVEESEESGGDGDYYQLTTPTTPAGAGSITRSVMPDAQGYLADTQLTLTAAPFAGYVFTGWTGDAAGPQNSINVVMSGNRTVMANFLRFDNSGLPNVDITFASPDIYSVSVVPYPTASIPSSPEGFRLLSAYIVEPQGSGSFSLQFSGLPDANFVAIFKVQDGAWAQLPRSVVSATAIQVTMGAEDPVIALVTPGSSGGGIVSSVQGLFSGVDSTTLVVIGIAVVLVAIVIVVLVLYMRRESY